MDSCRGHKDETAVTQIINIPVTICARLFPSVPWVHTSFKTVGAHLLKTVGAHEAKQRTLRVSSKKSWLRSALSTAGWEWLWRRQELLVTAVRSGSGCILGRYSLVRRDTPSAPRAHMLRSNPRRSSHGGRHRY